MVDSLVFPIVFRTIDRDGWKCLKVTLKRFKYRINEHWCICVGIETAVVVYFKHELTKNGEREFFHLLKVARKRVRKIVALCSFAIVYETLRI